MQVDQGGFILLRYTLWWGPKSSSYLQRHHLLVHVYNICAMYMNMKKNKHFKHFPLSCQKI